MRRCPGLAAAHVPAPAIRRLPARHRTSSTARPGSSGPSGASPMTSPRPEPKWCPPVPGTDNAGRPHPSQTASDAVPDRGHQDKQQDHVHGRTSLQWAVPEQWPATATPRPADRPNQGRDGDQLRCTGPGSATARRGTLLASIPGRLPVRRHRAAASALAAVAAAAGEIPDGRRHVDPAEEPPTRIRDGETRQPNRDGVETQAVG